MQNQSAPRPHGVPESFYSKFGQYVTAVLSGFDRIRFRATLRVLYQPAMMEPYAIATSENYSIPTLTKLSNVVASPRL
jgi:hypothetical protein